MGIFNALSGLFRTAYNDTADTEGEIAALAAKISPRGKKRKVKAKDDPKGKLRYFDNKGRGTFLPLGTKARRAAIRKIILARTGATPYRFTYEVGRAGENLLVNVVLAK